MQRPLHWFACPAGMAVQRGTGGLPAQARAAALLWHAPQRARLHHAIGAPHCATCNLCVPSIPWTQPGACAGAAPSLLSGPPPEPDQAHRLSLSVSSTTSTVGSLGRKVYWQKDIERGVATRPQVPPVLLWYCRSRSTMLTAAHSTQAATLGARHAGWGWRDCPRCPSRRVGLARPSQGVPGTCPRRRGSSVCSVRRRGRGAVNLRDRCSSRPPSRHG